MPRSTRSSMPRSRADCSTTPPDGSGPGPRLLHDRFGRAREQCRRRRRAPADRPGAAALPLGRLLLRARASADRTRPGPRRARRHARAHARNRSPAGRHKVFGHHDLADHPPDLDDRVPPAAGPRRRVRDRRARRLGVPSAWPADALAVCSFGDASANHSTAQGAINAAAYTAFTRTAGARCCSSARTTASASACRPPAVGSRRRSRTARARATPRSTAPIRSAVFTVDARLAEQIRTHRPPGVPPPRAPSDTSATPAPTSSRRYRTPSAIRGDYDRDPILGTARQLVSRRRRTATELVDDLSGRRDRDVGRGRSSWSSRPTADVASRGDRSRSRRAGPTSSGRSPRPPRRPSVATDGVRPTSCPRTAVELTLAETINRTLADVLAAAAQTPWSSARTSAAKGGVYGVTRGPPEAVRGGSRVRHAARRAVDPRGRARRRRVRPSSRSRRSSTSPTSTTPRTSSAARRPACRSSRTASTGTRSSCGSPATPTRRVSAVISTTTTRSRSLRDIPGLVIAQPVASVRRGADAADVRRRRDRRRHRVSAFLEPIALYHTRDLHEPGDGVWTAPYAAPASGRTSTSPIGRGSARSRRRRRADRDAGANGLSLSLRAARRSRRRGISCRVFDLRWLAPLPVDAARRPRAPGRPGARRRRDTSQRRRRRRRGRRARRARLLGRRSPGLPALDSFVPLGDAADLVLVDTAERRVAARVRAADRGVG